MHGARLVRELKTEHPEYQISAMGSDQLAAAGAEILVDAKDLAVVGFVEVLKVLGKLRTAFITLRTYIQLHKPKLVILIDYPGFNLRMAKVAKQSGCTVLYYISPQVWAWHQSRVKKIKRWVDMMAVIFPFEVNFFQQFDIPAKFVGHPLASAPLTTFTTQAAKQQLGFAETTTVIGLIPGSRNSEVKAILATLLATAKQLQQTNPAIRFVLPRATNIDQGWLTTEIQSCEANILITETDRYTTMQACDFAIAMSGTVTLELALLEKPMIIVYKGNPISFWLAQKLVKIKHIGLPNIVANKLIVPELLQNEANANKISVTAQGLLNDEKIPTSLQQLKAQLNDDNLKIPLIDIVTDLMSTKE